MVNRVELIEQYDFPAGMRVSIWIYSSTARKFWQCGRNKGLIITAVHLLKSVRIAGIMERFRPYA
jgi:hypothetical protein